MDIVDRIINRKTKISIIGLGYVGLQMAVSFSKHVDVIGYDINEKKISLLKNNIDYTNEVGNDALEACNVEFTSNPKLLCFSKFHIVTVPTPILKNNEPDLSFLIDASETIGKELTEHSVVVYESTVYPGLTEELCIPILEKMSGMKCGIDFRVGYSPERINPGDKYHRLDAITKIVSGIDQNTVEIISKIYNLIIHDIYCAESIKIAEASKIIENSQRDINIAFMNEMSMFLKTLNIDMKSVLNAAKTKWNFINVYPGLVGGHCISVDPYYLTHQANKNNCKLHMISTGREINNYMSEYISNDILQILSDCEACCVLILGVTYKPNCPDIRNSKVFDIIDILERNHVKVLIDDPVITNHCIVDDKLIFNNFNDIDEEVDAIVLAVPHEQYQNLQEKDFLAKMKPYGPKLFYDIYGVLEKEKIEQYGCMYMKL